MGARGAALWAAYRIVLGKRVAGAGNGLDDMAVGFAVAAVVLTPCCWWAVPPGSQPSRTRSSCCSRWASVLSSVVPYVLDQIVLRRLGQARFAVLLALLPRRPPSSASSRWRRSPARSRRRDRGGRRGRALRSRDGDSPEPLG